MICVERYHAFSDSLEFFEVIGKGTGKEDLGHCILFRLSKVFHEATKMMSLHGIWMTFFFP